MADYNIYIRDGSRGSQTKTTAWEETEGKTTAWGEKATETVNVAMNPDSLISKGFNFAKKAIPAVATAFLVAKAAQMAFETAHQFQVIETGDYRMTVAMGNFKQTINNIFHPFSSTINYNLAKANYRVEDERRAQQRELLGDAIINQYTGRGV